MVRTGDEADTQPFVVRTTDPYSLRFMAVIHDKVAEGRLPNGRPNDDCVFRTTQENFTQFVK